VPTLWGELALVIFFAARTPAVSPDTSAFEKIRPDFNFVSEKEEGMSGKKEGAW
jgi:hypothetical protein